MSYVVCVGLGRANSRPPPNAGPWTCRELQRLFWPRGRWTPAACWFVSRWQRWAEHSRACPPTSRHSGVPTYTMPTRTCWRWRRCCANRDEGLQSQMPRPPGPRSAVTPSRARRKCAATRACRRAALAAACRWGWPRCCHNVRRVAVPTASRAARERAGVAATRCNEHGLRIYHPGLRSRAATGFNFSCGALEPGLRLAIPALRNDANRAG